MIDADVMNERGRTHLPGHLGIVVVRLDPGHVEAEYTVRECVMASNGFLHAGGIVTLADTTCGYGCLANLPAGATGFTTVELKSNHLGTAREGTVVSVARPAHLGRSTQVWDAVVTHRESGRTIALFRCTQIILYPK